MLSQSRETVIGRGDREGDRPDIDLWPDRRVSRRHARIWFENGAWWVKDLNSRNGTVIGNHLLAAQQPARLDPFAEIRFGGTHLMLLPPQGHRIAFSGFAVELELVPAVNSAVATSGTRIITRLAVRNTGAEHSEAQQLVFTFDALAEAVVTVPPIAPGATATLSAPAFALRSHAAESLVERRWVPLSVALDERVVTPGIGTWFLACNEWSLMPEHRPTLAAFVLPNHPAVLAVAREAARGLPTTCPAGATLERIYHYLYTHWSIEYRFEPAHYEATAQKIRLPDQVLSDFVARKGAGTCLDLALLLAACLESLHAQPLVAIVDLDKSWHALAGCWCRASVRLDPVVVERQPLLDEAVWTDPNGLTRDALHRMPFREAMEAAAGAVRDRLVFAVDVASARADRVMPLPFTGDPQWSGPVLEAIARADEVARSARAPRGVVALVIGLLRAGELTPRVFRQAGGDPVTAAERLMGIPKPSQSLGPPTKHYLDMLALAKVRARSEDAVVVDERHLLGAILDGHSSALDDALRQLRLERGALLDALRSLIGAPSPAGADTSLFVEPVRRPPRSLSKRRGRRPDREKQHEGR